MREIRKQTEVCGRKEEDKKARCTRAETPLQPVVRGQAVPLQPMEVTGGADAHLQPVEDPTLEQMAAPKEGWNSEGNPCWSSLFLGGL